MDEGGYRGASGPVNPFAAPAASLEVPASLAVGRGAFRSLLPMARALTTLLVLLAVVEAAGLVYPQVQPTPMGIIVIEAVDALLWLAVAVLFCFFMPRANRNARVLGGETAAATMQFTPRRTVLAFFIPIANLWRPYHAMKEIWQWSDPDPTLPSSAVRVPAFLPWWWTVYLIDNVVGQISARMTDAKDISELAPKTVPAVLAAATSIAAAALAAVVVQAVARRQEQRQQRRVQAV